jgi:hypothetical protein
VPSGITYIFSPEYSAKVIEEDVGLPADGVGHTLNHFNEIHLPVFPGNNRRGSS